MYEPNQIANYFLFKYGQTQGMTPMKLIKMVYIAHGWYLAQQNKLLINENAQAWKFGPVIPSLYNRFKVYGNGQITETVNSDIDNPEVTAFLDEVWVAYGELNGIQLSSLTHMNNTPWSQVWANALSQDRLNLEIPNRLIQEHYRILDANQGN
jgi:uncharacterized phage-associated protein